MDYLWITLGIILLLLGGDWLVKASVDLALRARVSVLVVGMTVVSFATSAPELLVSLDAAINGFVDISFGNVLGSNMANIALILGLTAMIFPLDVSRKTVRVDYGIMLAVTFLLLIFLLDKYLAFWESALLFGILIVYNVLQIRGSRKSNKLKTEGVGELKSTPLLKPWLMVLYLAAGIAGLRFGADFLIKGAANIAENFGISERVIGITIVSVGTSLPELAASLVASLKGERDLSLGNLIGSNIFNILAVLGITGLFVELPVKSAALLYYDFPWLIGISLLLFLFIAVVTPGRITRWQGLTLFLGYLLYILGVLFI